MSAVRTYKYDCMLSVTFEVEAESKDEAERILLSIINEPTSIVAGDSGSGEDVYGEGLLIGEADFAGMED